MEELKRARRPYRALLTRAINNIHGVLEADKPDEVVLRTHYESIQDTFNKVDQYDQEILNLLFSANESDETIDKELDSVEEYKQKYRLTKIMLEKQLSLIENDNCSLTNTGKSNSINSKVIKYPKIDLKKFDGDLREYLSFWAQFKNIHEDPVISISDKFQYLVQSMVKGSKAQIVVSSYPQSDENYQKVVEAIQRRFGREELLVEVYVRELLKLVIANNTKGFNNKLSLMYDTLESHLRALESLGVTSDKYACMLYPLVESSLPEDILRAWQRSPVFNSCADKGKLGVLMEFLRREVEAEERITLAKDGFGLVEKPGPKVKREMTNLDERRFTAAGLHVSSNKVHPKNNCLFCEGAHETDRCVKAQNMSYEDKRNKITASRRCFVCFNQGHIAKNCKATVKCHVCRRRHYVIMCPEAASLRESKSDTTKPSTAAPGDAGVVASTTCRGGQILLQTIIVNIASPFGPKRVRVMLDSGAQRSYIYEDLAKKLQAPIVGEENIDQTLFGGSRSGPQTHQLYKILLESLNGKNKITVELLSQRVICGGIPKLEKGPWLKELSQKGVWINDMDKELNNIDILIGADLYSAVMTGKSCKLENGLMAFETIFGWTLLGKQKDGSSMTCLSVNNLFVSTGSIADLWSLETIGITDPAESVSKSEREEFARVHFQKTVTINDEGRYEVELPWIVEKSTLPDNRAVAEKRLASTYGKLHSSNQVDSYDKVFSEWLSEEFIEEVSASESTKQAHFLPHRPVFKASSETTPVRPVFDASCKTNKRISLNDCLEKGPNLLEQLPSIILRFRQKQIGVVSDIKKAFMMVSVCPRDRDFLRFLWQNKDGTIKELRHKRVVFGLNCSPFILGAVIDKHLNSAPQKLQRCAEMLKKCLYVDNCVTSVATVKELMTFKVEATELMGKAKMILRQWNYSALDSVISVEGDSTTQEEAEDCNFSSVSSVLGLTWDRIDDTLSCNIPQIEIKPVMSKRSLLSMVQRIFDPMGFLSPATLSLKLVLQETWIQKLGWDADLPVELWESFNSWLKEVRSLSGVRIPRWMTTKISDEATYSLHVFGDASQSAYAAVVFLRCETEGGFSVQLLLSKSRVAPIKKISIPRLELMACVLGVRLAHTVKISLEFLDVPTVYWSDSTTALCWIKGEQMWNVFVRNRVSEIRKFSRPRDWRYVPGTTNPADLPSRGCTPRKLLDSHWWEGPAWLRKSEAEWPSESIPVDEQSVRAELMLPTAANVSIAGGAPWYVLSLDSYRKNLRVMGWILRFVNNTRGKNHPGELSVGEINVAERKIIWLVQQESLAKLKGARQIYTQVDEDGLVRVVTKITRGNDPYDFRFPYLLPSKHLMVDALVRQVHEENCHAGVQIMMTKLRERFWILQSRKTIARVKAKCSRCKRFEERPYKTEAAVLPKDRVEEAAVFQVTGVDLAGPLYLKDNSKVWVVLFTCAVYRAVHLELVSGLSTECFLQALRRFIARRGRPSVIYSDNGTNFRGCDNGFRAIDWKTITPKLAVDRIKWKFNPPSASWWGGWWERIIRIIKQLLVRMLGRALLNYEEMSTVLCDVEAVINSRPLTYVSEDSQDLVPLTPATLLQDIRSSAVCDIDELENNGFRKRYRYRQRLRNDFRCRFRKEYLGQLGVKRQEGGRRIAVGDVVLVDTGEKKRILWPLALVLEVYPGPDGNVRVAKLKTAAGEMTRPVQRLYLMEATDCDSLRESAKKMCDEEAPTLTSPDETSLECEDVPSRDSVTRTGRVVRPPKKFDI